MGPDVMIFVFWTLSFKPTFSLSSFTFIKRLFSASSLSAIRVVSSAIWGYWYFSQQSWSQLVFHPAWHFVWCTLHIFPLLFDSVTLFVIEATQILFLKNKHFFDSLVLYNRKGKPVLCCAYTALGPLSCLCVLGFPVSFHYYLPAPALSTNSPQAVELIYLNRESQKFLEIYDPHGAVLNFWGLVGWLQGYKYASFFALWLTQLSVWSTLCPENGNFDINSELPSVGHYLI